MTSQAPNRHPEMLQRRIEGVYEYLNSVELGYLRERFAEIKLRPATSADPISLKIVVGSQSEYRTPVIEPGQPLRWSNPPCNIPPTSQFEVRVYRHYFLGLRCERIGSVAYSPTDGGLPGTWRNLNSSGWSMTVIFPSLNPVENDAPPVILDPAPQGSAGANAQAQVGSAPLVIPDATTQALPDSVTHRPPEAAQPAPDASVQPDAAPHTPEDTVSQRLANAAQALEDAKAKERPKRLLEKLGPVRNIMDTLLKFGGAVVELDPRAKGAFSLFTKAWETLEVQEECDATVETLINGLADILPSVEAVKHAARLLLLQKDIEALLEFIAHASQFVIEYNSTGAAVLTLRAFVGSSAQEQVDLMLAKLRDLKEKFDRSISIQTLQTIDNHAKQTLFRELRPVNEAQYDSDRACIPGTRREILQSILEWSKQVPTSGSPTSTGNLLWVHGQAGLGKSAIATSICEELDEFNWLAASFFCKRDDPDRRSPQRVLSTIIFGLAIHHSAYAEALRNALEEDPTVPGSPMRKQFDKLVRKPLGSPKLATSPTQHVVVIDALDECDEKDRGNLLGLLWSASTLVPWLKVIVTSRPSSDIQAVFDRDGE
ncbi:hypothetical protein FRC09_016112, partial [Ceratobasidium sp. 395]